VLVAAMFGTDDVARERSVVSRRGVAKDPRRVVTGIDEHGRSIASADGAPPNTWGDAEHVHVVELWQTMAPLVHYAQGGDTANGELQWPPTGAGIAWRHVSLAPGADVSLHGTRLDLVLVRSGEISVDVAHRSRFSAGRRTAIIRRGLAVDLRNDGDAPADVSVLSVCSGAASDGNA
jgi:hypothetical protein